MTGASPISTPMASSFQTSTSSPAFANPTLFRQILGSLQYLQLTRPDIAFAVNRLAQRMQRPSDEDWSALKRVLRYLKGSVDMGLFLPKSGSLRLTAYSDADWAGDRLDCCSTSSYLLYLGPCLVSWKSFKQRTVARSSTEAEYRALASAAAELAWVQSLLSELGVESETAPHLLCDNLSATYISANPVFHSRMKHLAIDYHFVRQRAQLGLLRIKHVPSVDQLADTLTKPLPRARFVQLRSKLRVAPVSPNLRGHVEGKSNTFPVIQNSNQGD